MTFSHGSSLPIDYRMTADSLPSSAGEISAPRVAVAAEIVGESVAVSTWKPRSWPVRFWHGLWWLGECLFGLVSLIVALAIFATIPVLNFVSLGYLLESSGKIARTGKFRDGLSDLMLWSRLGSLALGTWIVLVPLRFLSQVAYETYIIAPGTIASGGQRIFLLICTAIVTAHIALAWYCGGKLRHFFWPFLAPFSLVQWAINSRLLVPIVRPVVERLWPRLAEDLFRVVPLAQWFPPAMLFAGLRRGPLTMYAEARDAVWDYTVSLRLPYHWWLGVRGFVGAMIWLALPMFFIAVFFVAKKDEAAGLAAIIGFPLLMLALRYLPFVQTRFAAQNRFRAFFEIFPLWELFRRAPILFWLATLLTFAAGLPLMLFKVAPVPPELAWLPGVVFIAAMYPVRLLNGWIMGIAEHRDRRRSLIVRWIMWFALWPVLFFFVLFLALSRYTSWNGTWSLFEQFLFLIPSPFFSA